jgi:hypothetical protein
MVHYRKVAGCSSNAIIVLAATTYVKLIPINGGASIPYG